MIATEEPARDATLLRRDPRGMRDIRSPSSLRGGTATHLPPSGSGICSPAACERRYGALGGLISAREILRSYGIRDRSIVIATSAGMYDPAGIRCHFPNDPRLAGPLQLSRFQRPAAAEDLPEATPRTGEA